MELQEINNLKQPLLDGEVIEVANEDDLVILHHSKVLGGGEEFIIELNGKVISMHKRFDAFRSKLLKLANERNLAIRNDEDNEEF